MSLLSRLYVRGARRLLRPPRPLLDRLPPVERDGLRLDPQVQWMLGMQRLAGRGPLERYPPERARENMRFEQSLADIVPPPPLHEVRDLQIEGAAGPLPARLYRPAPPAGPGPGLLYVHGGGFVVGDLDTHDTACRLLARDSGVAVLSVDYRLAPEHPFPAAVEDALAAWRWVVGAGAELGLDPTRLAVGGDSAGGCLAAVVAQQQVARAGPRPWFQMLAYPAVDGTFSAASIRELRDAYVLPYDILLKLRAAYAGGWQDFTDPRFSPLFGQDFAELPQSFLLTGGFDPLQDEGAEYASRLRAAGVRVDHSHFAGEIHGFISLTRLIPQGTEALQQIAGWLRGLG